MPVVNYVWDVVSDNVLMETDDEGNTLARYVQEPELYGEAISQERDGQVRYYDYDGLGNTSELTDENQNVTDTYEYSAFGEEIARTGTTENPFRYKGALGYYTNAETDDAYVRARTYEPILARWLSFDPLSFIDSLNLFVYGANNPLQFVDPNGCAKYPQGARVKTRSGHPNINPAAPKPANGLGSDFKFRWESGDPPTFAQQVTTEGLFILHDACGFIHSVSWEEQFAEAWVIGTKNQTHQGFVDKHLTRPTDPAKYIELNLPGTLTKTSPTTLQIEYSSPAGASPVDVEAWSFYMKTTFDMRNGRYPLWPVRIGQLRQFFTTDPNVFSITSLVIKNASIPNPQPAGVFKKMLYPGPGDAPPALPGFPPPFVAPSFDGRTSVVSEDVWRITWEEGDMEPTFHYSAQYVPK